MSEIEKPELVVASIKAQLEKVEPSRRQRILEAIALAVLGSIPWVGGFLSASATFKFNELGAHGNSLRTQWLEKHQLKLIELEQTLNQMFSRLENLGEEIDERLASEQYLALVRKAFREWDQADTEDKRKLIMQLITNAAGIRICSDDLLRLFLDWIKNYHESHFAVIREIYSRPGPTRYDIWVAVYGETIPRDDSADADLYKMLIRDLSTGGVVRQARETDESGRFRKRASSPRRLSRSNTIETPFEDTKQYVLTEMGKQFVHYTMNELVTRIEASSSNTAE